MSDVHLFLQSTASSGFAVGDVWKAFVQAAFDRWSFTAFYGVDSEPVLLKLPPGDYWVQLKLPHGELTKDLVTVPDQAAPYDVVLRIAEVPQSTTQSVSAFPALSRTVLQSIDPGLRRLPAASKNAPVLTEGIRRTRSIKPPVNVLQLPTYPLDRLTQFEVVGDKSVQADFALPAHFSLIRLRGKFSGWPRRIVSVARQRNDGFVQPEDYFKSVLRSTSQEPMSVVVDGNSLTSEIVTVGDARSERSKRDIADGRVTRDLVVLKGHRSPIRMLVAIPNGWNGDSAHLRVTASESVGGSAIRLSVEVKDPKFNALLQFMKGGDLDSAIRIIESSVEILYAKFQNPFAAAAAGYVLIQAAPQTLRVPWQVWIGNLGHYFKDLPDGEILHATLLLQRGDAAAWLDPYADDQGHYFPTDEVGRNKLAAQLILSALGKGPPMFRAGLSLLASNLRILESVALPDDVKLLLNEGVRLVTWLSMRVDPSEPFSVFHLRG